MPEELPTCECVEAQPQIDKLRSIYGVARQIAGDPEALPEYGCVRTVPDLLSNIYCAILLW